MKTGILMTKFQRIVGFRIKCLLWIYLLCGSLGIQSLKTPKCPHTCLCSVDKITGDLRVDCTKKNLTSFPEGLDFNTVTLDLSLNEVSSLPERAFSNLTRLEYLFMVSNSISSLSANVFTGLHKLIHLSLQGNKLQTVPAEALSDLPSLRTLHLDNNQITSVPDNSFKTLRSLSNLRLDVNLLRAIPVTALNQAKNLEAINFEYNQIEEVPDNAFVNLTNLAVAMLSNNALSNIGDHAFYGLQVLKLLDLSNNRLTEIPAAINDLPDLFDLSVRENKIEYLADDCFSSNKKLSLLNLKDNPIASCGMNTFSGLPKLVELVLSEAHELTSFPNLAGSNGLEKITIDRASITSLPDKLCQNLHALTVLDVHTNHISSIPNMSDCSALTSLNLGNNGISEIVGSPLEGLRSLKDLILSYNKIKYISDKAFVGLHKLQYLDLSNNLISYIHPNAFADLKSLEDLNVGENQFDSLPTKGLQRLRHLKTFHNTRLQEPLPYDAFPHILTLKVAYAYHCCAFINQYKGDKNVKEALTFDEKVTWLTNPNATLFYPDRTNISYDWDSGYYYDDFDPPLYDMELNQSILNTTQFPHYNQIETIYTYENMVRIKPPVRCEPLPDPFQPCDDLFGWWSLRCGVWIVFLLAVLGNGTVLFVSLTSKSKMDVTRFLICNLAMSDLCMGIYLGFLAVVDASTLGKFENHAIYWQTGPGCLVAGFLGVLSSELSVFTLVVITVERFYAISHAMQIGKRVRLGHAGIVMACGWVLCLVIASLPLFKVSDYRKFAICLPFDTEDEISLAYVCFIMIFNAISFIVIVICYGGMFISIRASHTWNSKDSIVAKRMALLVFTDFFCWAPIIFFSLTAAFNWHLARISIDEAKVLTIFVLPLNSCANPFLYAFFTRQFKRDCVKLCKRIEESSISRHFSSSGLGRMSAVSHRHHPNNSCSGKRSCENSLNEPSTSGEASSSNNPSDDSDLTVRKLPLTREDKQILHYMRSGVRLPPSRLASPTELSSPESERRPMLKTRRDVDLESRAATLSPRQTLTDEEIDSSHDIVLHTKEGNVYLSAKPKTFKSVRTKEGKIRFHRTDKCAQRLCNHSVKSTKRVQSIPFGSRSVHSQTADSNGDDGNIKSVNDMESETINKGVDDNARKKFETDRSKELGLKIDNFKSKPVQVNSIFEPEVTQRKTISTQTEMLVPLRHTRKPDLTADITKREKDKHINEWRKTSHLSFLWRNSGNFDVLNQKQKSNSLVELTRPLANLQNVATKRHSLTSKHEGYILLKNSSRDSAYEEDELYEFYDGNIKCLDVEKQNYKSSEKKTKCDKNKSEITKEYNGCSQKMDFSMDSEEMCETSMLLTDRLPDNLCIPKGRQSCDIESGISSSS
ncbi:leucine-rich repeat-containing G-protein coupled receptor 5-like isoform X1 [Mercenaria mercenaria]|uniref:leucine-rich repeat-containing G-protein coupled receptor 5-like isoform X1 n=1 Tax=Mercenaria mercenaria TaxID=6596 RepID=UPI00234F1F5E|nr:leucine-rich repeat-containing G-protein coupled receptor 5-like isoform X1 [Mercenaria mercenaria]